jgi:hypothetical protein
MGFFNKIAAPSFFGKQIAPPFSETTTKTGPCVFLDFAEKKLDSFAP